MQKTFEPRPKSLPKWMPKPSKNLQKIDAKKDSNFRSSARKPGRPAGSRKEEEQKGYRNLQKDKQRKATCRRGVQRGTCRETNLEHLTRLGRLRARSGYIGATFFPGYPVKCLTELKSGGGASPDTSFRATIFEFTTSIFQLPTSTFQLPGSDFHIILHCSVLSPVSRLQSPVFFRFSQQFSHRFKAPKNCSEICFPNLGFL